MARPTSLKLVEITDRAILGILDDTAAPDGYAEVEVMARKLDIKHENPVGCVRMRLAWLGRYGMVEKGDDGRWAMTPQGRMLFEGRLKTAAQRALRSLEARELWAVTGLITMQYETLDGPDSHMVRREWTHHDQRRRLQARG